MMKAGVPLLQAFDIVGKGHSNPAVGRLLIDIKTEVETGSALNTAFRKYPLYFDALFCNLVGAGEAAGILDSLLDRLATYKEKILAIKSKIKAALFYPISIIVVAFVITAVIMIFVIPAFKDVFSSFGADLPGTDAVRDGDVRLLRAVLVHHLRRRSAAASGSSSTRGSARSRCRSSWTGMFLRLPIFGDMIRKATIARWTRTLATMFAAGVPLVEALDSVGGAVGQLRLRARPPRRSSRKSAPAPASRWPCRTAMCSPTWCIQMVAIGEESGSLDAMLSKVADFFEAEVDDAVDALSSLMEPMIMVVLGTLIGGMVIAMYLPIFKMGQAV